VLHVLQTRAQLVLLVQLVLWVQLVLGLLVLGVLWVLVQG